MPSESPTSLYPQTRYFRYGPKIGSPILGVVVGGYQEAISIDAFERINKTVPFDLTHDKKLVKGYAAWDHVYQSVDADTVVQNNRYLKLMAQYDIEGGSFIEQDLSKVEAVPLKEFYAAIGYEYKAKKLNGLTLKQHILKGVEAAQKNKRDLEGEK